ncbi:MAG: hypothetical protein IPM54_44985 [Polyangiaceae bacterium]|nr:hypothetical protein [Polyangiaceae bacterium]
MLLVAVASAIGCADEAPGPGPIPLQELRDELSTATCNQYVRCGLMPDQATCEAAQGDSRLTLQLLTDAALGRVTYDEAGARTCVEAIRARSCDNLTATQKALADACSKMFVGTIPEGSSCLFSTECAGGGTCNVSMCMGSGACCLGVCEKPPAPVAIGADCTTNPCVESAYCDASEMPPTCKARKDNGDACDAQGQCKEGMRCDVSGSLPTCYLLSNRNGACNPALEAGGCIRFDDYCHPTDRKCTPLPGDGQPCTEDGQCMAYAHCDAGTCRKRPTEGGACSDTIDCLGTLECVDMVCAVDPSTQVCAY